MPEAPEVHPGEQWAYRARRIDDLVEVEVVKLGTQKPARVQVRLFMSVLRAVRSGCHQRD